MMIIENGELNQWSDESKEFFEQELKKQLNVIGEQECPYSIWKKGLCSNMGNINHKFVLNNGVVVGVSARLRAGAPDTGHKCYASMNEALSGRGIHYGSCAYILVDINGRSKPNKNGKDTFEFRVYTDGVLPKGHVQRDSNDGFSECFSGATVESNTNCTAWVIYHENMDYLKCRDKLSYDKGPYSCEK